MVYGVAKPFPNKSVMLLVCMITVYVVPFASFVVGVMMSVLPVMVLVNDIAFPLEVFSSIQELVPNLMASLKLILITLFVGIFTALLTGFVLFTVGAVFTGVLDSAEVVMLAVLNSVIYCVVKPFPAKSVILLGFNVSVYHVFAARVVEGL